MIVYLYRWKLVPEKKDQFIQAWSYVTAQLREKCGSYGSRLHNGGDGLWYGYAQWPSVNQREQGNLQHEEILEARRLMKDAVAEIFPDVLLTPVSDYLASPQ